VRLLLDYGFDGPVYPVNPNLSQLLGLPCYPSLIHIPGPVDYVISCIPASGVLELVEQCAQKGVGLIHFFTARFSETGRQPAAALEQELLARARRHHIRLIGPNCIGLYYPRHGLSFRYNLPRESGPVGLLSQSGGNAALIVQGAGTRGLRFSQVISYGNALDINEADLLEHLGADPETRVIGAYIEGVKEGRRFFRTLQQVTPHKPVIVLKGGRTSPGRRATQSHTASLAGSEGVWQAMLRQARAVAAADLKELIDLLVTFAWLPPTCGVRVGIAGGGGGPTVEAADQCHEAGLEVIPLPDDIRGAIKDRAPLVWDWVGNPADQSILLQTGIEAEDVLKMMAQSPEFDLLIGNATTDSPFEPHLEERLLHKELSAWLEIRRSSSKPLAVVIGATEGSSPWRQQMFTQLQTQLGAARIPTYPSMRRAARALSRFIQYHRLNR